MTIRHRMAMIAILLFPLSASADGFKLMLEANKIVGKNTENISPDYLFGHNFDFTNNLDGTYESSHGSMDANDPGSGFNFPDGGPNDSFTYNVQGLWTYTGGAAVRASPGMILDILKASDGAPLAQIDGPIATPATFSIAATSTHELIWSVPQSSPTEVWGLAVTITGISATSGLPYEESDPFVTVQWTPHFHGDTDAAMQAIYAAAVDPNVTPIPGDYNDDGQVTVADYEFWKLHFGEKVEPFLLADGNGDGSIDAADYTVWRDAFSQAPVGVGGVAVPEPATALLAAFGSVTAFLGYRRRKA